VVCVGRHGDVEAGEGRQVGEERAQAVHGQSVGGLFGSVLVVGGL
jgi:hypothetical protein